MSRGSGGRTCEELGGNNVTRSLLPRNVVFSRLSYVIDASCTIDRERLLRLRTAVACVKHRVLKLKIKINPSRIRSVLERGRLLFTAQRKRKYDARSEQTTSRRVCIGTLATHVQNDETTLPGISRNTRPRWIECTVGISR